MMLFDWIYPTYTPVMQRAVEIWYQDPQVTDAQDPQATDALL